MAPVTLHCLCYPRCSTYAFRLQGWAIDPAITHVREMPPCKGVCAAWLSCLVAQGAEGSSVEKLLHV